jgi:plasmid stability protein
MSESVLLTIVTAIDVAPALRLRAAKEGTSPGAVVNAILRQALAAEMEEAAGTPPLADVIRDVTKAVARNSGPTASYWPVPDE